MMKKLSIFFSAIICCSTLQAQEKIPTAMLDSFMNQLFTHHKALLSVSIARNGHILYSKAVSYLKEEAPGAPLADHNTRFRIGSITKMFTSVMIFQLIEEKKLTLETPLSDFYKEIPNARSITIGQLLSHHSGIHNFTDESTYLSWHNKPQSQKEIIARIAKSPSDFTPGSKGSYSNSNYVLLGFIIEKLTGEKYADALQKRIVKKINLANTAVGGATNTAKNEAFSFSLTDDKWKPDGNQTDMTITGGAGNIISTPEDLNKFIAALFDGHLISKESLDQMTTIRDEYGMGIFRYPYGKRHTWGHTGGIDDFHSILCYFPDDSLSVAVTSNGLNYVMNDILLNILNSIYMPGYTLLVFKEEKTVVVSDEMLTRYQGIYAADGIPLKITISKEDGHLMAQATGQSAFPLEGTSDTDFKFDMAGIRLSFSDIRDNRAQQMILNQKGTNIVFKRAE